MSSRTFASGNPKALPGHPDPLMATMTEDQLALAANDAAFLAGERGTHGLQISITGTPSRVWRLCSERGPGKSVHIREVHGAERAVSKTDLIDAGAQAVRQPEWSDEDKAYIRIARALVVLG